MVPLEGILGGCLRGYSAVAIIDPFDNLVQRLNVRDVGEEVDIDEFVFSVIDEVCTW